MKVLIVAKTRMGKGACIGGTTFQGQSVRLVAADVDVNETVGMEYSVGDVWDIEGEPAENVIPPHVENVIVRKQRRLPPLDDPLAFIKRHMPPREGGLEQLYEGLTQATQKGALYITERCGIPPYSTTFWAPDQPLRRIDDGKRIRYRYPTADGGRTLTFVGFQEPVEVIEPGTVLRVSLAHWWRPEEMPDGEYRCYVQLSGWFQPQAAGHWFVDDYGEVSPASEIAQPVVSRPAQEPMALLAAVRPDMDRALHLLNTVFGYDEFWPLQADIIENILDKRDTVAIMPTGGGKSLCYQLPALMFCGLTVVVSPLISLMQDQVDQLREWDVPAVFLNSTLSYRDYVQTAHRIRQGAVKLLYVAPETLLRSETLVLLDQCQVDCLTIDEAHCISSWGHDFRPVYRQLVTIRRRLPEAVCFALTATATTRVQNDIKEQLAIDDAGEFVASFNRENLFLEVQAKSDGRSQMLDFLNDHRDQSGIIYCATRQQVDDLAADLSADGWSALPYHAGLDSDTRRRHQTRFSRDQVQIMVATVAFGMGIDKSNVRFVVHYNLPKDIESYYQEIGRSGRDSLRADCLLLYSSSDVLTINYFIRQKEPNEQRAAKLRLGALIRYAETNTCRRRPLLNYFGENYDAESCGMCDNCLSGERELVDLTIQAQMFLSCVKRTGERFGVSYISDVLRGSKAQRILKFGHEKLSTHGIGRDYSKKQWVNMARQFIQQGLLVQEMEHGSLKLRPKAYDVFRGEKVMGIAPERESRRTRYLKDAPDYDARLYELLRAKLMELAEARGVPPFIIFSDRSLVEMAIYYPQSRESFSRMYGVGRAKLEKYADHFLPLICEYCSAQQIAEKSKLRPAGSRGGSKGQQVGRAYQSGQSIDGLAAELGIKRSTVLNHLQKYLWTGNSLPAEGFLDVSGLPAETQAQVLAAYETHGADYLRPVYEAMDEAVSYDELRIMRLYYLGEKGGGQ
jgi:ATP-dependent DNA helicase RecQ